MRQLDSTLLASEAAETLIFPILSDKVHRQRFFYKGNKLASMWQTISALSVCLAIDFPLFLQSPQACGKKEAVCHFSSNRRFILVLQFIQFHVVLKHQ
jgi:hypothetical protein